MSIEYHGWIVLATSNSDWDDGDIDRAFDRVQRLLKMLLPEEGHAAFLPQSDLVARIVYLSGFDVDSIDKVMNLMRDIGLVFDKAYGELIAANVSGGTWTRALGERYVLEEGYVTAMRSEREDSTDQGRITGHH